MKTIKKVQPNPQNRVTFILDGQEATGHVRGIADGCCTVRIGNAYHHIKNQDIVTLVTGLGTYQKIASGTYSYRPHGRLMSSSYRYR